MEYFENIFKRIHFQFNFMNKVEKIDFVFVFHVNKIQGSDENASN